MDNDFLFCDVTDRKSFVNFLTLMHKDFLKNGENWENNSLGSFLEALCVYAEDVEGYYANNKEMIGTHINADKADWRVFADILRGATMQE